VRPALLAASAALVLAATASASSQPWHPSATWLAQARCIHLKEGPWNANTGNGYFGGMQFSAQTWKRVGGSADGAFAHPGDPAYPFSATPQEQLYRAWLLWKRDNGTWHSWGAVGASCS
jgi:resuscitation-promoting factor RpfB